MRPVSDSVLLAIWERGSREHPLDRALTLIASAGDEGASRAALAQLPMAERDRRLFRIAAALFGPQITVIAECPDCGAETELSFAAATIDDMPAPAGPLTLIHDGAVIPYRLPDSRDLACALAQPDPQAARAALLGALLDRPSPPPALLGALDAALAANAGPEALTLSHVCAGCGAERDAPFDILDYLWRRLTARARRAMRDIHLLARAYGWTSDEILSLSAPRRAAHIAMVTA